MLQHSKYLVQWVLDYRDDYVQKKFPIIEKNPSPRLSGSQYCEYLLVKMDFFYKSRYCEDYGIQGSNNRELPAESVLDKNSSVENPIL